MSSSFLFRARFIILFNIVLMMTMPLAALAQEQKNAGESMYYIPPGTDYTARPYYDMLVRQLIGQKEGYFNFGFLRGRYTMIEIYDPVGDTQRDALLKHAFTVKNSPEKAEIAKALEDYNAVLHEHIANLAVVVQALSLSKQDRRLGKPSFFEYVRNGLLKDVVYSGDGSSLSGAYDVVTLAEETMLLSHLNVEVKETVSRISGDTYYNMHSVTDRKTGKSYTVFVNVTLPMRFLDYKAKEKGAISDIPKQ